MDYLRRETVMPRHDLKAPNLFKVCQYCTPQVQLQTQQQFVRHLREAHCRQEGGSFVCHYGYNGVCSSLPVEGVSDMDYETHVIKQHADTMPSPVHRISPSLEGMRSCHRPVLVSNQGTWNFYKSSQNLSAALNDPNRPKQKDLFTKAWGDGFVQTQPCHDDSDIAREDFELYSRKIGKRYRKHLRRQNELSPKSSLSNDNLVKHFPNLKKSWSSEPREADLDSIPKIFLKNQFDLADPETFECVFKLSSCSPLSPTASPQHGVSIPQHSHTLLQEQMSHYLDIVEVKIARQIAEKKVELFEAMSSHKALTEQLSKTIAAVTTLRQRMKEMDDGTVKGCLKVIRLQRLRRNYMQVYKKHKIMSTVHQTQPTVQLLLSTSEYLGALCLISTTQDVLRQELSSVACLRNLGAQLEETESLIDKLLQADLLRWYHYDLNRAHSDHSVAQDQEQLAAVLMGMLRQKKYSFVDTYRDEAITAIKALVKQAVIETVSSVETIDTECPAVTLDDQLKLLDFSSWVDMMEQVFQRLEVLLRRVEVVYKLMLEVTNAAAGRQSSSHNLDGSPLSPTVLDEVDDVTLSVPEYQCVIMSLHTMKCDICNYSQEKCSRLFTSRASHRLKTQEFIKLHQKVESFIKGAEKISGQHSSNLNSALQAQSRSFVQRFHEEFKNNLSLTLDSEQWKCVDIPSEFQCQIEHLSMNNDLLAKENVPSCNSSSSQSLDLCGETFAVVGSCIVVMRMVWEYMRCASDVPQLAPKLSSKLGELLCHFNTRSSQLLLGARARQSAGLKKITATNLVLCWRSLQLVLTLLSNINTYFVSITDSNSEQLEKAEKEISAHSSKIQGKLAEIGSGSIEELLSTWQAKPPSPSQPLRTICKQLQKLHEAVSPILAPHDTKQVFLEIHRRCLMALKARVDKLEIVNDGGPQHGIVTQELTFYATHLINLGCVTSQEVGSTYTQDFWRQR